MTNSELYKKFKKEYTEKDVQQCFRQLHQKWYEYFWENKHISMDEFEILNEFMAFFEDTMEYIVKEKNEEILWENIPVVMLNAFNEMNDNE